jgi:hypothetical protein
MREYRLEPVPLATQVTLQGRMVLTAAEFAAASGSRE